MSDASRSVPPPSAQSHPERDAEPAPGVDVELALEAPPGGPAGEHRLRLESRRITIEHAGVLRAPLRMALALVKLAAVDPGPAAVSGQAGRFPILRQLTRTTVIPREEGIEGWLWTSTGGTALTDLNGEQAPNAALVFTKPLDDVLVRGAFEPAFLQALAARSPLGTPVVPGLVFRVADTLAAGRAFRRWGFQDIVTDRDLAPAQRRHLPGDKPADPMVRGANTEAARARTSVAPPGF